MESGTFWLNPTDCRRLVALRRFTARSSGLDLRRFLKFGLLAWGGPAAQIAMIKRECVDEERWVSEETFKKTLAVYQVLPGPEAHELCVYFGRMRGGKPGAFLAGMGFHAPRVRSLMLGLSVLYPEADLADHLDELFYGLTAAVGAIVARALVRLSRTFITDVPLALLAVAAFALTVFVSANFALVLIGAGVAYELWNNAERWNRRAHSFSLGPGDRDPGRDDQPPSDGRDFLGGLESRLGDVWRGVHGDPLLARRGRGGAALADREPVRGRAGDERRPARTAGLLEDAGHIRIGHEALVALLVPIEDHPDSARIGWVAEYARSAAAVLSSLLQTLVLNVLRNLSKSSTAAVARTIETPVSVG